MRLNLFVSIIFILLSACKDSTSNLGDSYFRQGEFEQAVQAYTEYLKMQPADPKTLYNRGRAYEELQQLDAALTDFEAVYKADDRNINAVMSIGGIYYRKADFGNAAYYYDFAVKLNPNSARAFEMRGRSHQRLGKVTEAMTDYNNALRINKDYGDVYMARGSLYLVLKQKDKACADFKIARSLEVKSAEGLIKKYC